MLHVIFDEEYAKLKLSTSFISTFVRITQKLRKRQRAFAIIGLRLSLWIHRNLVRGADR